ncbi:hypothetical protein D3C84_988460 [compost metagenome]
MNTDELDAWVRDSFQCSPGPSADKGRWLPIEDPTLLASLTRQRALEQLWFGVLRNQRGQVLGMDVCLQRFAQRFDVERWPVAALSEK